MSTSLLDVNILLAIFDPEHIHHSRVKEWLDDELHHGWASCAITQNGFVRIASQASYPGRRSTRDAIDRLSEATSTAEHTYWECSISLLNEALIDRSKVLGPNQVTDVYLLALATSNGGRLVTMDRGVPVAAVPRATPDNLVTL